MQVGAWMHGTQGQELVCFTNRMNDSCWITWRFARYMTPDGPNAPTFQHTQRCVSWRCQTVPFAHQNQSKHLLGGVASGWYFEVFLAVKMLDSILYIRCLYIYISKVNLKNNRYKRNKRPCWTASCISDIIYIRTFRMLDSICCTEPWKTMFSKVLLSLLLNKQAQSFRISKHAWNRVEI